MLAGWSAFFGLTGAAAATLVGLLFVVVTLGNGLSTARTRQIADASMTPALYSFASVLFQAMLALAPWPNDRLAGLILLGLGVIATGYRLIGIRLRRKVQLAAIETRADWVIFNIVPVLAGAALVVGGFGLTFGAHWSPFAVAASTALFLLGGIYQAWTETLALITLKGGS